MGEGYQAYVTDVETKESTDQSQRFTTFPVQE